MHIGLNLVFLVPGETGGTEVYARELISELVVAAPGSRFTAFVSREGAEARDAPWGDLVEAVTVPVRSRRRAEWVRGEQQLLPRLAARTGVDLVHSLANTGPSWGHFRRVVTIHDLHYRVVPEAHLGLRGLGMRVLVPLAARRSDRIIAVSQSTRSELVRVARVPPGKVDVVPQGIGSPPVVAALPQDALRARFRLGQRRFVLCVAAKRPHKNLIRLLGALALIPSDRRPVLVLPGYPTSHEQDLRRCAAELGIEDDVRLLGWVDQSELEGLYASAACFVLPSLHEGFGLPVLEAMVRGLAVACSSRGALAEVTGDAALHFDPDSEASISAAIERLLGDPAEVERLAAAGRERAAQFSWAATAAGTLGCYERTLQAAISSCP